MDNSVVYQVLTFIFVIIAVTLQILATTGVFNGVKYEMAIISFTSFVNVPQAALITLVYIPIISVFISTCTQLMGHFKKHSGSHWLRKIAIPIIISSALYTASIVLACYYDFIASAVLMGLHAIVVESYVYNIFYLRHKKMGVIERRYWREHYAGWHFVSLYLFILTLTAAVGDSGSTIIQKPWWFFLWMGALFIVVYALYIVLRQIGISAILLTAIFTLMAYIYFSESKQVGIFAIVLAAVLPLSLGIFIDVNLIDEDEEKGVQLKHPMH